MSENKEKDVLETLKNINTQMVFISLSNGKRGVFVGPELISLTEMSLSPPRITEVVFDKPRPRKQETITEVK